MVTSVSVADAADAFMLASTMAFNSASVPGSTCPWYASSALASAAALMGLALAVTAVLAVGAGAQTPKAATGTEKPSKQVAAVDEGAPVAKGTQAIVVLVNDEPITAWEIEQRAALIAANAQANPREMQAKASARWALEPFERDGAEGPFQIQHDLQDMMQDLVGIVRKEEEMKRALEGLQKLRERAARVESTGGWLDLAARKLVAPPAALLAALEQVPRAPGFVCSGHV